MTLRRRVRILVMIFLVECALLLAVLYGKAHEPAVLPSMPAGLLPPLARKIEDPFRVVKRFPMDTPEALKKWEEKIFRGKSEYTLGFEAGQAFLQSVSKGASSGLFLRVEFAAEPELFLSWKWRALEFPKKKRPEKLADRGQDDFAARVYVVFPGSTFFNSNVIEYIWDESLPEGTVSSSPFSGRVKLFVIRSGRRPEGADWQVETRNLYQDYRDLFGQEPKRPVGAIAVMSDSDNTGTESRADFGDFTLKEKKEGAANG